MKRLRYILILLLASVTYGQTINPQPKNATSKFISMTTATTTQVIAAPLTGTLYVTTVDLNTRTAGTGSAIQIVAGTGTNCATGQVALTPAYANTAAGVLHLVFQSPLVPARLNAICAIQSGTAGTTDVLVAGFNAP